MGVMGYRLSGLFMLVVSCGSPQHAEDQERGAPLDALVCGAKEGRVHLTSRELEPTKRAYHELGRTISAEGASQGTARGLYRFCPGAPGQEAHVTVQTTSGIAGVDDAAVEALRATHCPPRAVACREVLYEVSMTVKRVMTVEPVDGPIGPIGR